MVETMNIKCPFCNADFPVDIYTGESSLNCDATLSRTSTLQLNLHDLYNEICNGYINKVLSEGNRISFQLEDGRYASVIVAAINLYEENGMTEECDFKDKQFPIFKTKNGRVKSLKNGNTWYYWLRSPFVTFSTTFWYVNYNGNYNHSSSANYSYGVCPCFSICSKTQDG